jgi:flagellar assembly factor FliW
MDTGVAEERIVLATSRGDILIDPSDIIHFPEGLFGFERFTDFVILDINDCPPFKSMLSVEEGGPDFIVIEPKLVFDDYTPFAVMQESTPPAGGVEDVVLLSIVTLSEHPEHITVNLCGPILLNPRTHCASQIVIPDDRFKTKVPLLRE